MSEISDPGRAGRGDRRRAQKLIDTAYASGRLTAADRAFRTERVDSAHTKGDLAILVRDLDRAEAATVAGPPTTATLQPADPTSGPSPSLGSAIPPDQLKAMTKRGPAAAIRSGKTVRTTLTGDHVKRIRLIIVMVVVGFLLLTGLGVVGLVAAVFTGIDRISDSIEGTPAPTVNLQSSEGWSELVAAVKQETGTSRVYDAVVYPEYASVNTVADEGAMRYVYRGGSFDLLNTPVTPAHGEPVDLSDIDPDLVAGLPDQTAERQGMPEYDSAYLIVNTMTGQPAIMVYVQQEGRLSRWSIYDLDGKVIGGTPD